METFTVDTVVALASFLSPHDMLCLALSCKRFGARHGTNTKRSADREEGSMRNVKQKTESISLMEVAAHTVLHAKWTDEEKNALPRRGDESWIGLYQEFLKMFRLPLQFDKLVGDRMKYVEGTNKTKVCTKRFVRDPSDSGAAICQNIMRAGKHYASFQLNASDQEEYEMVHYGIMRPTTNDIKYLRKCHPAHTDLSNFSLEDYGRLHGNKNVDCCLMDTYSGCGTMRKRWKRWKNTELAGMDVETAVNNRLQNLSHPFNWEGIEGTREASFKIGLELDLDEGTLDVYKNGRRLGTLMSGLVGEYCWVVSFIAEFSVSIGR